MNNYDIRLLGEVYTQIWDEYAKMLGKWNVILRQILDIDIAPSEDLKLSLK